MKVRVWLLLPLARTLAPELGDPPRAVLVLGPAALRDALAALGYDAAADAADGEAALALCDRPTPESLDAAAAKLGDRGRIVVVDRGLSRPPAERRTWQLARAGFVEVGQTDVGRVRLTTGTRLRLP